MSQNKKHRKNGEGTLFKRSDGRWQASFVPTNGKRLYFYGKTQAEALEKMRQAQHEDQKGILAMGPKQKLGEYLIQWLENVHKPTVRVSTYVEYRSIINHHLVPDLGHIFIQKLTPQHIQAFYTRKLKEGLKPKSVVLIHAVLHRAFENAVKWGLVSRNIVSLVSVPRIEAYEVHPLTSSEAQKLLEVARGHWLEPLLVLALTTGMRRGELLALRWSDIDLEKSTLSVQHTTNRYAGYGFIENDTKTRKSRRKVILSDIAIGALKRHRTLQNQTKVEAGEKWQEKNLVFTNPCGDFLGPWMVLKHFHRLLEKAGLPPMRFHDVRRFNDCKIALKGQKVRAITF